MEVMRCEVLSYVFSQDTAGAEVSSVAAANQFKKDFKKDFTLFVM